MPNTWTAREYQALCTMNGYGASRPWMTAAEMYEGPSACFEMFDPREMVLRTILDATRWGIFIGPAETLWTFDGESFQYADGILQERVMEFLGADYDPRHAAQARAVFLKEEWTPKTPGVGWGFQQALDEFNWILRHP